MIRGTTPFFTMTIEGHDLTDKTVYATVGQNGTTIVKTGDDLDVSYVNGMTIIQMKLSQADTLKLQRGRADVEVKFIDEDGTVLATETKQLSVVEKTLLERQIRFVESEDDA